MPIFIVVFVIVIAVILNVRSRHEKSRARAQHQARRHRTTRYHRAARTHHATTPNYPTSTPPLTHITPTEPIRHTTPTEPLVQAPTPRVVAPADGSYPGDFTGRLPARRGYDRALPQEGSLVQALIPAPDATGSASVGTVVIIGYEQPWLLGMVVTAVPDGGPATGMDLGPVFLQGVSQQLQADPERIIRIHPDPNAWEDLDATITRSQVLALRREF